MRLSVQLPFESYYLGATPPQIRMNTGFLLTFCTFPEQLMFNGYLVSYAISDRPVLSMVTTMLDKAFATIPDGTGLILHSDQGWQYQHKQYQQMLKAKGVRQSMSRKGNCLDNAVAENFFGLLKSELLYLQKFHSMEHFKQELIDYLDYYNNRRIKAKLKGLPPAIHRLQALSVA